MHFIVKTIKYIRYFLLTIIKLNGNVGREQDSDVTALTRYVFYAEIGIR